MIKVSFGRDWIDTFGGLEDLLVMRLYSYFLDNTFDLPFCPQVGMDINIASFLDDTFTDDEKELIMNEAFAVSSVSVSLNHVFIILEKE